MTTPTRFERAETFALPRSATAAPGASVLSHFAQDPGAIGDFTRAYNARETETGTAWVDSFFVTAATRHLESGSSPAADDIRLAPDVREIIRDTVALIAPQSVRLLAVLPRYFRGFLAPDRPIDLSGTLVVVFGRNSTGKTSLAEALEWLFTGKLARREQGDSRELAGCVGNQFRPAGETTSVAATFRIADRDTTLKRVLTQDYGDAGTSRCQSDMYRDGNLLSETDTAAILASLFAGVAPLLMQHTLRSFVHNNPSGRRDYFERLLRLDDLTHLIEKAVVGDARLREFPSDTGSLALRGWTALSSVYASNARVKPLLRRLATCANPEIDECVRNALHGIALVAFPALAGATASLDAIRGRVAMEQQSARQRGFNQLAVLAPKRTVDESVRIDLDLTSLQLKFESASASYQTLMRARKAADLISQAQRVVAQAVALLETADLVDAQAAIQLCPLCESTPASLPGARVASIREWHPTVKALERAEAQATKDAAALKAQLATIWKIRGELLPQLPDSEMWTVAVEAAAPSVQDSAAIALAVLSRSHETLAEFVTMLVTVGTALRDAPLSEDTFVEVRRSRSIIEEGLSRITDWGVQYRTTYDELERVVGTRAKDDPEYAKRETWLSADNNVDGIAGDLRWEKAKRAAQEELRLVRERLIEVRKDLLELRRSSFNDGMSAVWRSLRDDQYARFDALRIPPPRGNGFPVVIEVKAILEGPGGPQAVDALRVFSESQVHVLGIAAFVTRSKLVGHRLLIFDDPVQSMDEDHFRTFAGPFLKQLLGEGFQVIILTHNQTFEKRLSYEHFETDGYFTLNTKYTRRKGCYIEEGNRRVTERLDAAEHKMDEGDHDGAWIAVRRSLERLYTLVRLKHGSPGFDPMSWNRLPAEAMWNEAAGQLICARVPDAGRRLKATLEMTAGGAHDSEQDGPTDLRASTRYIRSILDDLRVGD